MTLLGLMPLSCSWVESSRIRGPDGRNDWLLISCHGSHSACLESAGDECPHGYIIASDAAWQETSGGYANRNTSSVYTYSSRHGEMLIHCKDESTLTDREERMNPGAPPVIKPARDLSLCIKAEAHSTDAAALWAARSPERALRDAPPSHDAFVKTCANLDEPVQICLNASYAKNHEADCASTFDAMSVRDRKRVDELFFRE